MMSDEFSPFRFFDAVRGVPGELFTGVERVWEVLPRIAGFLNGLEPGAFQVLGEVAPGAVLGERVAVGKGTVIEPGAFIKGPAWIGENCQIRHGCYIRENVVVGDGSVLGNSCEFKNCLLFDGAEVPHFNYVGDSVLGHRAHLGAGVILSNVRLDRSTIRVQARDAKSPDGGHEYLETGLRKFGAIIGDFTEVGCNSVLSPGSVVGRNCLLYPGTQWRGTLSDHSIVRLRQDLAVFSKPRDSRETMG